jgi:hypothetical protein
MRVRNRQGGTSTTVACVPQGKGDHLSVWGCSRCNFFTNTFTGSTKDENAFKFEAGLQRQIIAWRSIAKSSTASPKAVTAAKKVLVYLYTQGLIA